MMFAQLFGSMLIIKTMIDFDMVNLWNEISLFLSDDRDHENRIRLQVSHKSEKWVLLFVNDCVWCNDLFVLRLWNMKREVKRRWTNSLRKNYRNAFDVCFGCFSKAFGLFFCRMSKQISFFFPFSSPSFTNSCKSIIIVLKRFPIWRFSVIANKSEQCSIKQTSTCDTWAHCTFFAFVKFTADCDVWFC